jgi:hypothetical protein
MKKYFAFHKTSKKTGVAGQVQKIDIVLVLGSNFV